MLMIIVAFTQIWPERKVKLFCTKWPKKLEIGPFPSFEKVALQVKLLQAKQIGFLHNCAIAF